jgi:hypothetical protein
MIFEGTRQVSKVTTRPAPIKGLNSFDSIIGMPEGFALILRNFYAQPYGCQVRKGYRQHVTNLNGKVESVCSHNKSPAALYAFVGDTAAVQMHDVTTPTSTPLPPILSGLTNARWQHVNHSNVAGVSMVAVNGADNLIWAQPNGAVVTVSAGNGSLNTIAGVDPKALIHCYIHQQRLWFVEKNSTRGWYMPPDQITGIAQAFDFGPNWTRGGQLSQIVTWTIDDGNGADDHLVAISTEGQVSVYAGTDVEGADTWTLQGVYFAGAPVGRRAAVRYGGDIMLITQYGIVFLSDLLKSTKVNPTQENDAKYVQQLVAAAISLTGERFGWQSFVYPGNNMFFVNVPATDTTQFQFVMNDITKAWSEFIGYNANCWELHQQLGFYGSFGAVYRAWEGTTDGSILGEYLGLFNASSGNLPSPGPFKDGDNYQIEVPGTLLLYDKASGTQSSVAVIKGAKITYFNSLSTADGWYLGNDLAGAPINAEAQTTFSYFESLGQQKHYKMVRPTILSLGSFEINFSVNTDFVFDSPVAPGAFSASQPGRWDRDLWDRATWAGGLRTFKSWQAVRGIGTAASIRLLARSAQETYWATTDWLFEKGGVM